MKNRRIQTFILLFYILLSSQLSVAETVPLYNFGALKAHYVKVGNGSLEYYRFGVGSPIVLISGYATNVSSWNRQFLSALAQQHEIIIFNNRQVDGSAVKSKTYTTQDLAQDTYQLITKLKLKQPSLLGISMGGMIAQQYAVLYPQTISSLILINTAIAGNKSISPNHTVEQVILHTPSGKIRRFILVMQLLAPPRWRIPLAVSLVRDRFQPADSKDLLGVSEKTLKLQQQLVLDWSKNNIAGHQLSQLQTPTLILSGGADAVIPSLNSDVLALTIPHTKLFRWMDGGHAMIYQYPYDIAAAINQYLSFQGL